MLWKILVAIASFLTGNFHRTEDAFDLGPQSEEAARTAFQALYGGHQEMIPNPSGAGIKDNSTRWDGFPGKGEVPYVIHGSLSSIEKLINKAIDQYHKHTCIKFVKRTNQKNYINMVKDRSYGCASYVGKIGGAQKLYLGNGCEYVGTIVHELGHAIGLYHEHQRSDRDDYLNVYEKNVVSGQGHNFKKTDPKKEFSLPKYDYTSIMHYGEYAFSKRPKQLKTMEAKDKTPLKEPYDKSGLNDNDIELVKNLYQCK